MGAGGNSVKIGTTLADRYELIQVIANGGMAQVWIGTDLDLNESVAIKVLHPHLAEDEKFCSRFIREAEAASGLQHPSIVAIRDSIEEDGVYAIVMDYIEGKNLREYLDEKKTVSVEEAMAFGFEVAEALSVAHDAEIVHRDIKPANIMIREDGCAVITDFGIAKAISDRDLTATGMLLGTAKYLSPEQVTGDKTDGRSDLYSLAVVIYESLGGIAPFVADNEAATALLRLQKPAPLLSEIASEINDETLVDFLKKALNKKAEERFQTAADFAEGLEALDQDGKLKSRQVDSITEDSPVIDTTKAVENPDKELELDTSPHNRTIETVSSPKPGLLIPVVGGLMLFGAFIFAIIMLLNSLAEISNETTSDGPIEISNYAVLVDNTTLEDDMNADLAFDEDEETSWIVEDLEEATLLLELDETRDLSEITLSASPSDTVFDIRFYRADSVISEPIATLSLESNQMAELDLSAITFISIGFERAIDADPTALREIELL